jgi:hemerythrin-like metal-binding protein/PAS domain S-box-containing protein
MQATQEDSMKREDDFLRELKEMEAINRTLEQQTSLQDNEIEGLKRKYNISNKLVNERESYEKALYNIISAAIITTNEDGIIQYVNELFIDLLGYKSAEVLGRSVYTILGFETKETEMAKALQAEYGSIVNTKGKEINVKHKNGNNIQFWLTVTANIFNEKVIYTIVLNDQTKIIIERNKAVGFEEEMLIYKFELENKTEALEALLVKNKIELPGLDQEYTIVDYAQNRVGLNIIDSQAKKWIEHINKFYADFKRKAAPKAILQSMDELIDYTGYHFGFEDKYLRDFKYSQLDSILEKHKSFTTTLQQHRASYAAGENIALIKAVTFIKSWMNNYKSMIDTEFITLFKSHGLS